MKIEVNNIQSDMEVVTAWVEATVLSTLAYKGVSTDEVTINLVSEETISGLHADFFQDPSPTDCITFPIDEASREGEAHHVLGEIFVCPKTAINYAKTHGHVPLEELQLYIIHGILHLLGFDDQTDVDSAEMRKQEAECLKFCSTSNLPVG